MTDLNAALRAAILHDLLLIDTDGTIAIRLKSGVYRTRMHKLQDEIADAIVAAIQPILDEGATVEWAYRYPNGHVATWIPQLMTEDLARSVADQHPDLLTAVRRRVTAWEAADAS